MTSDVLPFPSLPTKFPSKTSWNPRISSISFISEQMYVCMCAYARAARVFRMVGSEGNQGNTWLAEGYAERAGRKCSEMAAACPGAIHGRPGALRITGPPQGACNP